jgi:hypothetical protein
MAIAINVFKTVTANVTTLGSEIYTAPSGYTSVVLMAHVSNVSGNTITVTSDHIRSGATTNIITAAPLPANDAMTLLSGKMILQTGDKMSIRASANAAAQIILSILETANP